MAIKNHVFKNLRHWLSFKDPEMMRWSFPLYLRGSGDRKERNQKMGKSKAEWTMVHLKSETHSNTDTQSEAEVDFKIGFYGKNCRMQWHRLWNRDLKGKAEMERERSMGKKTVWNRRNSCWGSSSSARSCAHFTHSFACLTLLTSFTRSAALTRS